MDVLLTALIVALFLGFPLWLTARNRDEFRNSWLAAEERIVEVVGERDAAVTVAENAVGLAERYKGDLDNARADLAWAGIIQTTQAAELDRTFRMPTIAGMRAERADRDNVVELAGKRGRA